MKSRGSPVLFQMQPEPFRHLTTHPQRGGPDQGKRTSSSHTNPFTPSPSHTPLVDVEPCWPAQLGYLTSLILVQRRLIVSRRQHNMNEDSNVDMDFESPYELNNNVVCNNYFLCGQPGDVAQQVDNPHYNRMYGEPVSFVSTTGSYTDYAPSEMSFEHFSGAESSPSLSSSGSLDGYGPFSPRSTNSYDEGVDQTPTSTTNHWNGNRIRLQQVQNRTVSLPELERSGYSDIQETARKLALNRAASQPQPQIPSNWSNVVQSPEHSQYLAAQKPPSLFLGLPIEVSNRPPSTRVSATVFSNTATQVGSLDEPTLDLSRGYRKFTPLPLTEDPSTAGFQCNYCKRTFKIKSGRENLSRHRRLHCRMNGMIRAEKPKCCKCGTKFSREDNLRKHVKKFHTDKGEKSAPNETVRAPSKFTA